MRIVLLMAQLAIVGALYNLIAVPLLMMASGLVYALVVAAETVFLAVGMGVLEVVLSLLPPLLPSMSGAAGGGSVILALGGALSQAATATLVIASPLLLAVLVNLVCGFLSYYRNWFAKMRRWACIGNIVCLSCYLLPQLLFIGMAIVDASSSKSGPGMTWSSVLVLILFSALWDAYFFVVLALWRYMPERPDAIKTMRRLPAVHVVLCVTLVTGFALALYMAGPVPGRFLIVAACVLLCLSALLLLGNARASKRIAREMKKRFALPVLLLTATAAAVCLVLAPPVGAILLLSAAALHFLFEAVFLGGEGGAAALEELPSDAAPRES